MSQRTTTITISRILIVSGIRQTPHTFLLPFYTPTDPSNEIINKTTEKCGKAEKMIFTFFHHHPSSCLAKASEREVSEENNLRLPGRVVGWSGEWNKTHINMYSESVWSGGKKWVSRRWRRMEIISEAGKNPKYIYVVMGSMIKNTREAESCT